ncbi:MAG TPA: hypothetical protein DEH02_10280 [Bacteroidales bacterium]|nr:hypothetical protein [Bacteroidales bacterium]
MESIDFEKETLIAAKKIKEKKYNSFLSGAVGGLLLPLIAFFLFYLFLAPKNFTFSDFINQTRYLNLTTPILSICVIPNLLLFFICLWTNRLFSARGVVFTTMIFAFAVVVIKFIV